MTHVRYRGAGRVGKRGQVDRGANRQVEGDKGRRDEETRRQRIDKDR